MGPKHENNLELSHKAKRNIENHCKELGDKGLNWTLVFRLACVEKCRLTKARIEFFSQGSSWRTSTDSWVLLELHY